MSNISPAAEGENDAAFEARISKMSNFEEIRQAMRERRVEQGLVRPDNDPYHLIEVAQSAPAFTQVVEFGGQKNTISGESELDLARKVSDFYRSRMGGEQQQTQTQQSRDDQGRFKSRADEPPTQVTEAQLTEQQQNRLMDMVDARAALVRGEITSEDFAAITLRHQGIDPATLREVVQERQDAAEVQSWQAAVEEFRNSVEGQSWPGGNRNRDILGEILKTSSLIDEADKVAALKAAYLYAREHDLLVQNDEVSYRQALEECKSQKEIDAVNARYRESLGLQTNQGSTFWGSR